MDITRARLDLITEESTVPIEDRPELDPLTRSALQTVSAKIGGETAQITYAGKQADFVGLDLVNLKVPRSLSGRGEVEVVLTVNGVTANPVLVNLK